MGRREDRAALESTWTTYEPRVPGTPFRKKDIADADERAALGEPSHPGEPLLPAARSAARPDGDYSAILPRKLLARFGR